VGVARVVHPYTLFSISHKITPGGILPEFRLNIDLLPYPSLIIKFLRAKRVYEVYDPYEAY
jgi:hypothetical protein